MAVKKQEKPAKEQDQIRGIAPYLQVPRTGEAIAWYARVFGAREVRARSVAPGGTCMNAEIEIEGTRLMLADEMPKIGSTSPEAEMVAAFQAMMDE